jgi:hypothetical protein
MFARISTFMGGVPDLDQGIVLARERIAPRLEKHHGFEGVMLIGERAAAPVARRRAASGDGLRSVGGAIRRRDPCARRPGRRGGGGERCRAAACVLGFQDGSGFATGRRSRTGRGLGLVGHGGAIDLGQDLAADALEPAEVVEVGAPGLAGRQVSVDQPAGVLVRIQELVYEFGQVVERVSPSRM